MYPLESRSEMPNKTLIFKNKITKFEPICLYFMMMKEARKKLKNKGTCFDNESMKSEKRENRNCSARSGDFDVNCHS